MQLRLSDPSYADRLVIFLRSLGQTVLDAGFGQLEVIAANRSTGDEIAIYLRVWNVLYPDADVALGNGNDGDNPAA